MHPNQTDSPLNKAKEHVDNSANFMEFSELNLSKENLDNAIEGEENAIDELIKALQELTDNEQQDNQQEEEQDEQAQQAQDEQAQDILDEEEKNKEEREVQSDGRYYEPDKDW